ncbi:thyroglobulin [Vombatus ursinus]|uniref:thyroglobulin n=1 Tax=Vombatus ursinus TaxID=29139 RepID=UPI000FFD178D|nr:thyroglobulin [Vombatus ursinus]
MVGLLLGSLLCLASTALGNIFEYEVDFQPLRPCELQREQAFLEKEDYIPQCLADGRFRNVQCSNDGLSCWCVDAEGKEVPGSKQAGLPAACLSFCQLQKQQILVSSYINSTTTSYLPQCQDSGEYELVQCDLGMVQCWCVDYEGMEVYGTRQRGKPTRCPRSCEIRNRRILHGVGGKSPSQCSSDGEFMPVQCKFANTTDRMVFDLVHSYNRFPEAFWTFSSFRSRFPEVSGYCHCADSQGRELAETGLELLLDEVYDTIFAGLDPAPTFEETTLYRILQRRFLAVHLVTSGRFRCPTKCEVERLAADSFGHAYTPSCRDNGDYQPVQCQQGGLCWCVDADGKEIYGTRQQGKLPSCDAERSCVSERQQALSKLFFGPGGRFSQRSLFFAPEERQESQKVAGFGKSCPPSFKELFVDSGLLLPLTERGDAKQLFPLETVLIEAIRAIFPSRDLALLALQFTTDPKRLQQNLFGGKFLENISRFNLSGAIGAKSTFNFTQFFQQIGLEVIENKGDLVELTKQLLVGQDSIRDEEVPGDSKKRLNLNQAIVGSFGQKINLQENQNRLKFLASVLELPEFLLFLKSVISVPKNVARSLGDVVKLALNSQACEQPSSELFVPTCTEEGSYDQVQCFAGECWCVDPQGGELPHTRIRGQRPRCPTECEKERGRAQVLMRSLPAGASLSVPSCSSDGSFLPVQCSDSGCYCVNSEGQAIPRTETVNGEPKQCPTTCQLAAEQMFLQTIQAILDEPSLLPQLSDIYIPQCNSKGQWKRVQCNGPPEQAFKWYQRWITQNIGGQELSPAELIQKMVSYRETSQTFSNYIEKLYEAGQQNIFPLLTGYSSFQAVPIEVLEGNVTMSGDDILFDPFTFWQLLTGQLSYYPGRYTDFSAPLGHFELRGCWCVDENGQELKGTQVKPNKVPACPGACEEARLQVVQFIEEAEEIIRASNSSQFALEESFLMAKGILLSDEELSRPVSFPSGEAFSNKLFRGIDYALQRAARSTFSFYQRSYSALGNPVKEATLLGYQPYVPQCDGLGNWEPLQCSESTGHCWCVDEKGKYVVDSLAARSTRLPQCPSACETSRTNGLLSSWERGGTEDDASPGDLFTPSCLETGEYNQLQESGSNTWCVNPTSGEGIRFGQLPSNSSVQCPSICTMLMEKATLREAGNGYIPTCVEKDGRFSPVQCDQDQESCWCVLENGEEVPGTRVTGGPPSCESPQCPLPFRASGVVHGVVLCEKGTNQGQAVQQCQIMCRQGYHIALPQGPFICNVENQRWISEPPLPQACQKLQLLQTVQTQVQFHLQLPPGKMCSADYSGLLQAFQSFILDELKARGFCQIQVNTFGSTAYFPVCDDSTVQVECLTVERLGVNVTWRSQLEDISATSLPDFHDIENAFVGNDLVGRFVKLIQSGGFQLHLDSKTFPADTTIQFLQGDYFDISPSVQFGCKKGFQKNSPPAKTVLYSPGCVVCPEGSYFLGEKCVPCSIGFYQEQPGSLACVRCPTGRSTISTGAFSQSHCVTDCQRNELGLKCDDDGSYIPSQKDLSDGRYFCVDSLGKMLTWTPTDGPLTNSQCLMLRKFERVPEYKVIFNANDTMVVQSKTVKGEFPLMQCLSDCSIDEACTFFTVIGAGSDAVCDFYASMYINIDCVASSQEQDALGNTAATSFGQLNCLLKVKNDDKASVTVYLKKGYEFTTSGQKTYEKMDFQDALSGVYQSIMFSADGANLTDTHLYCRLACDREPCCDGFILTQTLLRGGTILCNLMSSPDVLLCNKNDWRPSSEVQSYGLCDNVKYDPRKKQFTLSLGGQEFTGSSEPLEEDPSLFTSFQEVYLWKDSDVATQAKSTECSRDTVSFQHSFSFSDSTMELFSQVDTELVLIDGNRTMPSQQYWLFKLQFSVQQANLWCLSRCAQENTFCQLAEVQNTSSGDFICTLFPEAQRCDNSLTFTPESCTFVLPYRPQTLFHKKAELGDRVKAFYTRLPFQVLRGISVRSKMPMTRKSVSNGFFECERRCDADPCCKGFGFLNVSQTEGGEVLCLTLGNLGFQTCSEETKGPWRISDCSPPDSEIKTYPFGWYQNPVVQNDAPTVCPSALLPPLLEKVSLDSWQSLDMSSVLIDSSIMNFDIAHISIDASSDFSAARDLCLSECYQKPACHITTLEVWPASVRCVFYPDTQSCTHSLQGHSCWLLLREEATYIYRKKGTSTLNYTTDPATVFIATQGTLKGRSEAIKVGAEWKRITQFFGVPYAAPPLAQKRFSAPESYSWTGSWEATVPRAKCWQPGFGKASSPTASEDCLYLNVFIPQNLGQNASVLVFFHNTGENGGRREQLDLEGSFLAAIGDVIVVTASYRVGIFGFLSTGSSEASGNWGLLDQVAALTWVQAHISSFGGDPRQVSVAADRGGADITSIHLLTTSASSRLFRRAVLMGGSVLSPAAAISQKRAQEQAAALAQEVSCPTSPYSDMMSCLRQKPADILNDAQTKLLAISGPFHYWGPVVDGIYLQETPIRALQRFLRVKVDLLIGSVQRDGLINRAKAIKKFEESQGRTSSKTAFYQALQNSLGGEDSETSIEAAATWYYSLEHSTEDYSSFSRALENATRDYFINCPIIDMANHWAREARGNIYMYYVPETYSQNSMELLADVQYAFGLPFHPQYEQQFTLEQKSLSLKIMKYFTNFIKTGNPNYPYDFSKKVLETTPLWPEFLPHTNGDNYKEFSPGLLNHQGLKKAECSFWSKYIRTLKASTGGAESQQPLGAEEDLGPGSVGIEAPSSVPEQGQKSYSK